jgi:hypothetical protein
MTGAFRASIHEAEVMADAIGILRNSVPFPSYPADLPAFLRTMDYHEVWEYCSRQTLFNFQLQDGSLIQFTSPESFSYLAAPVSLPTYEHFLLENGFEFQEIGQDLYSEYEQFLDELWLPKHGATPLRYDYAPHQYHEGRHPASHMHFGHANEIRIDVERILRPVSFVLFVSRQCYPENWHRYLTSGRADLPHLQRCIRDNLELVEKCFRGPIDILELRLV